MAQKVTIELVDDLDGRAASQSVMFALDGIDYSIDLNDKHAEKLRAALGEFIAKARRVGKTKAKGANRAPSGPTSREIREWAVSQGLEVPDRGRIPAEIREAFEQAS